MKKMFQEIQNYQFEIARNDEGKASKPGFKVVDQEDIDRLFVHTFKLLFTVARDLLKMT